MTNRLADAISPYLRSHADNPVDWFPWGDDAFAEAARRDVPVLVSIGYSTCHWCHVMARESFSDPELAADLNARFVAIKVDREEHPDVDAAYLAAASAFTSNLGWPLNVFTTPDGKVFFAGTYFPPESRRGQSSFRQVLDAVSEAWNQRRADVQQTASMVADALASATPERAERLPDAARLTAAASEITAREDQLFGGFGGAPKFPVAPALAFLFGGADAAARVVAVRTLEKMAASPLRDAIDGGFFRYSVQRDWSEPHYERMLYDNAQLLRLYADASVAESASVAGSASAANSGSVAELVEATSGVARFLVTTLRLPHGAFASAQDSESTVDGERVEGEYYKLDAGARSRQVPPARDEKVLTGWNGLAIGALAHAGFVRDEPAWIDAARDAADRLIATHRRPDGTLVRASIGDRTSAAPATLEDYGMFAGGLLELTLATGEAEYGVAARELIDATIAAAQRAGDRTAASPFAVPGGPDATLVAHGLALEADPSEGAYPSGLSAAAAAARSLYLLTGEQRYADAAAAAMQLIADQALVSPLSFGAALLAMASMEREPVQLVVVTAGAADASDLALISAARGRVDADVTGVVTEAQASAFAQAGFELFSGRVNVDGHATAYLCRNFVCRLPTTDAAKLLPAG
ncbi:MAG TPA: DUF255 domain-containing protein [Microbacteriaceae bacterium]|nr:DUF255 domain-containing protein [Microbacteriaceae bacterium]